MESEKKINVKIMSMAGQGGSAFSLTLLDIMKERDDVRALSSDMSTPAGLDKFKSIYPDRFFNVGIAEQNMIGMAAGLTEEGFCTISVAQACFITMRAFEQVRQYAGYMGLPLILVGIGSGLSLQYMGNTHYAIEDIALMRTIPGMTVIAPSDALEASKALVAAVNYGSPVYIRLYGGTGVKPVYDADYDFQIGKSICLRDGKDIQIIATGSMVLPALKVAVLLAGEGIETTVTNMHTVKPLDYGAIKTDCRLIVSIEEHSIIGGLGSAIANILSTRPKHPALLKIGINDTFVKVGSYDYLLNQCGLDIESIKKKIISNL